MWLETTTVTVPDYESAAIRVCEHQLRGEPVHRIEIRLGMGLLKRVGWELNDRLAVARGAGAHNGHLVIFKHPDGFKMRTKNPTHKYTKKDPLWGYIIFAANKWKLKCVNGGFPWEPLKNVDITDTVDGMKLDGPAVTAFLPKVYHPFNEETVKF